MPTKTLVDPESEEISLEASRRTFLESDLHLDHTNIIKYCDRPFKDVEEMNKTLIDNWNQTISPTDRVFYLGDLAFGRGSRKYHQLLPLLNGKMTFIKGSHDHKIPGLYSHYWIRIGGLTILLNHEPYFMLPGFKFWWGWTIHGHVHNNQPFMRPKSKKINVSVEAINYTPISLYEILTKIKEVS